VSRDVIAEAIDLAARLGGGRPIVRRNLADVAGAGLGPYAEGVVLVGVPPDEAWPAAVDGVTVVAPSTAADAKGLLLSAAFDDGPVLFVEPEWLPAGDAPDGDWRVPLGTAAVRRPGRDVTAIAYGRVVHDCTAVADPLAAGRRGIDVEVVDLRTLAPLDVDTVLASVGRTRNAVVVTAQEGRGGLAAELVACVQEELFAELEHPVLRATPSTFASTLSRLTT
jgi:pyruvate dehydrogenase E1 component beta subunit